MSEFVDKDVFVKLFTMLKNAGLMCAVAESCTGGLFADGLTDLAGSSECFDSALVCYSNEAKKRFLAVKQSSLEKFGAVSEEVAEEMACGLLQVCGVDIAISITGIAGPGGGSKQKPVGLVFIGVASKRKCEVVSCNFSGSRREIKRQATEKAAWLAVSMLSNVIL